MIPIFLQNGLILSVVYDVRSETRLTTLVRKKMFRLTFHLISSHWLIIVWLRTVTFVTWLPHGVHIPFLYSFVIILILYLSGEAYFGSSNVNSIVYEGVVDMLLVYTGNQIPSFLFEVASNLLISLASWPILVFWCITYFLSYFRYFSIIFPQTAQNGSYTWKSKGKHRPDARHFF